MNRAKALAVLHKISENCRMVTIDIITLDSTSANDHVTPENYRIKMKCGCEIHSCKELTHILEEYQLEMKQENSFLILYSKT